MLHGEPHQVTWGGKPCRHGVENVMKTCNKKVTKESRIHSSSDLMIQRRYYDASQNELTIIAQRRIKTIFKPNEIHIEPVALVLKLSSAGKIQHAHFYETEVVNLNQKWGTSYAKRVESATTEDAPFWERIFTWNRVSAFLSQSSWSGASTKSTEVGLKHLSPSVRSKKCAWLAEKEKEGDNWLKAQPWYDELTNMCVQDEQVELLRLSTHAKAKRCAWFEDEKKKSGEVAEIHTLVRFRALAAVCVDYSSSVYLSEQMPTSACNARGVKGFWTVLATFWLYLSAQRTK